MRARQRGFTLIELSIVLVIIGLVVGGILVAQTLIQTGEFKKLIRDVDLIRTSTEQFRSKYEYLPGDMPNATAYWGIQAGATGNDDTCYTSESTGIATCNGNGDNEIVAGHTGTGYHERARYWQHLSNAGYIAGQYTGYQGLFASEVRVGGINAMKGSINGTCYNLTTVAPLVTDTMYFVHDRQHIMENPGDKPTGASSPNRLIMTPAELKHIDSKIDDGKPGSGTVRGTKLGSPVAPNCTNSADPVVADYDLVRTTNECYLYILMGF